MTNNKLERAKSIVRYALSLDAEHGQLAPARGTGGCVMGREIQIDPRWSVTVTPDHRMGMGRHYENQVGLRVFAEAGYRIFRLDCYGEPKLIANLLGDEVSLFAFYPGPWEAWLGIDNGGDTQPYEPWLFADEQSADWQALTQTADFQLPPLRDGPMLPPPAAMLNGRQKSAFSKAAPRPTNL